MVAAQLPVFVTAMWASRRMALAPWPGLSDGGVLWFPDLTVPALEFAAQTVQVLHSVYRCSSRAAALESV